MVQVETCTIFRLRLKAQQRIPQIGDDTGLDFCIQQATRRALHCQQMEKQAETRSERAPQRRLQTIPKEQVLQFAPFEGLQMDQIQLPASQAERTRARAELLACPFLGFDTEVKPTFTAGEPLRGPDVVQFATGTAAYVFQMHDADNAQLVSDILTARAVVKVGFDLRSDQKQLMHLLRVYAQPLLDLDFVFSGRGYPRSIGVKAAIALLFQRQLLKSKRVTTSNWSKQPLEPRQILYAANDAFAAWAVLDALGLPMDQLPVWYGDADQVPVKASSARDARA